MPEVAAHAGVSLASASRALNGTGASPAMVARVRAAAEELGYTPDGTGRSLRLRRTFQIAFAVADIGNPVYVEMMTAIQHQVAERGYRLVVAESGDTPQETGALVRSFAAGLVDGIVISPLRIDDALRATLREATVPVVVVGRHLADDGLDSVQTDSAAGIVQAVEHVVGLGRRRVGFLNGPLDTTPGASRQRGFDAAVARADLPTADTELADDFTVAAGLAAAHRLFDRHTGDRALDAVVAANDLLAIGVLGAARARAIAVPGDLAVTGMDDTDIGRVYHPTLTSVSLGAAERGRAAARLILDRLDGGGDRAPRAVSVPPALQVRESTAGEVTR
nr:LacI family DNA-binding transcriptional regulator [Cellulomonas denverensis]